MAQQFRIREVDVTKGLETFEMVAKQNARLKAAEQAQERLVMQELGMGLREKAMELRQNQMLGKQVLDYGRYELAEKAAALKRIEDGIDIKMAGIGLAEKIADGEQRLALSDALALTPEGVPDGRTLFQRLTSNVAEERAKANEEFTAELSRIGPLRGDALKTFNSIMQMQQRLEVNDRVKQSGTSGTPKSPAPATINTIATLEGNIAKADAALKAAVQAGDDAEIRKNLAELKGLKKRKEVLQGSAPFDTPPQPQSTIIGNQPTPKLGTSGLAPMPQAGTLDVTDTVPLIPANIESPGKRIMNWGRLESATK